MSRSAIHRYPSSPRAAEALFQDVVQRHQPVNRQTRARVRDRRRVGFTARIDASPASSAPTASIPRRHRRRDVRRAQHERAVPSAAPYFSASRARSERARQSRRRRPARARSSQIIVPGRRAGIRSLTSYWAGTQKDAVNRGRALGDVRRDQVGPDRRYLMSRSRGTSLSYSAAKP